MPKSSEVAIELRKLADALDKEPEMKIARPILLFVYWNEKVDFQNTVRLLPKPLSKGDGGATLRVLYESPSLHIEASINRDNFCTLLEPAKPAVYTCDPILSLAEESALEDSHA